MIKIALVSENTLMIYFGDRIEPMINERVIQAQAMLREHLSNFIIELVPAYASLLVIFDVLQIYGEELQQRIEPLLVDGLAPSSQAKSPNLSNDFIHQVPVYYGSEVGFDLSYVATQTALSVSEVVGLHTAQVYRVYAIGFSPGFAFMGTLDQSLSLPRRAQPRLKIPAGSVAIAERQTGVYPSASPGGWHVLGRTILSISEVATTKPMTKVARDTASKNAIKAHAWPVLSVGDQVQFYAIDREQFLAAGGLLSDTAPTDA